MLSVKDKRVLDFYKTHTYINFETANILLVEMLERLLQKNDVNKDDILLTYLKKFDSNFGNLTTCVSDVRENMKLSSQNILNLQTTLTNIPASMMDNLTTRLTALRENQVREMERVFEANRHSSAEHIEKKMKTEIIDQIKGLLDTNMNDKLKTHLLQFENALKEEWKKTIKEIDRTDSPKTIIESFNSNLQIKCDSLQQFILKCHDQIKDTTSSHTETLNLVQTHFDRQKNSTFKGKDSEIKVEQCLNDTFPDSQITNTTGQPKAGDFLIERTDKPIIMIENKDYSANIPKEEIDKFIRDIEYKSCNGILISQKSGIARKKNFQIDIHNGFIIIFIHHLNFDFEKLRLAVDTIDHLSNTLKDFGVDSVDLKLSADTIKEINNEYQRFLIQRNALSESLKTFNRDMTKQLSQLEFPELSKVLSQQFTSTEETLYKCVYCHIKVYKNAKALAAHVRKCKVETQKHNECISIETSDE